MRGISPSLWNFPPSLYWLDREERRQGKPCTDPVLQAALFPYIRTLFLSSAEFPEAKLLHAYGTHCSQLSIAQLQYNTKYHILPDTSGSHVTNACTIRT